MFFVQQPHVYRKQHRNAKKKKTQSSVSKHNQRALFLILVGSRLPALEALHVHFHR